MTNNLWLLDIMSKSALPERKSYQHRGKLTEGFLNTEVILKALNIKPGQIILDAGCGNGYMSKAFSNAVSQSGKVYALDPDKYYIDALKKETKWTKIEAIEDGITTPTRLNQSSVDLIYISAVMHGFSKNQLQGFLCEI